METRDGSKYRVVGRPIPARSRPVPQDEAREIFELPRARSWSSFGALAGARALNEFVVDTFGRSGPAILHITGRRDFDLVRRRVRRPDYRVIPETERFGAALSAADLILARAGGTVWEIAAAGKPAVLVPYPFATGDHQAKNAEHFVRAGGAIMMRELDLDDVPDIVRSLLDDPARLRGWARRCSRPRDRTLPRRSRRSSLPSRPLDGRRIWFVGIGGAGLSAYAQLARAWGAEVGGWDRVETPYLEALARRRGRNRAESRPLPDGWDLVVSSAYRGVLGRSRADLLAELVALRRSIVVGGTHGKGTTAAMIAFVLREVGADPAWLIGAPVPQLGGNAGVGGGWLVVEGDESDRTVFGLPAEIAVVTNVELDHHSEFRSQAELEPRIRPVACDGARRRSRRAALRGRARAARRAQPAERWSGTCRSGGGGHRAGRRSGRACALRGYGQALRDRRAGRGHGRGRLRPPPDGDRGDAFRRARAVPGEDGSACSSSLTCTREHATSHASSRPRSLAPTTWP